jgi:hypothetical protein
MKKISTQQLILMKEKMEELEMTNDPIYQRIWEKILQREYEDVSATGGLATGGMGAVVSAQPSGLAGATIGTNWASNGGTTGSGDVSIPYNPSGSNRMFQTIPMGKNHGGRTGKKSRKKKLDLKALKDVFAKKQDYTDNQGDDKKERPKKIMNFNDFFKNDFNTIKK